MLTLVGIALLLAATLYAYRVPPPRDRKTSADAFSAERTQIILQNLLGSGAPHPIGSAANALVRENIVRRLSSLGYTAELQSGIVCNDAGTCGSPVNIVATLGNISGRGDAVLLASHYDSVPAGPGASDDGAAVATELEIARILAARPAPPHSVVLLFTDGEEAGLLGASLFVREHPLAKRVKAAVNLEARGTSGPSFMFETGSANSWLMRLYAAAIPHPLTNSLYYVVYKQLQNDTDFTVFKSAAYQGFNFAFIGHVGRYHTPLDSVANADAGSIQQQGDNALAVLSALANAPTLQPPLSESVFFDGFAQTLFIWPVGFTLPVALLSLALLLTETLILLHRKVVTVREISWGGLGAVCVPVAGTVLCAGLLAVLIAVGKVPPLGGDSWISQPYGMHVAAAAIALLAAAGTGSWLAKRAGFWGSWVAGTLLVAFLAVACAAVVPGAAFVWLLAAGAAGLAVLPHIFCLLRSRLAPAWTAEAAALLPALVIFAGLFALLTFMYMALGSLAWPISTLVLSLGSATLLPALTAAGGTARRRVIAASSVTILAGLGVTLYLPTYSTDWPEHVNVEYWYDADTGRSNYKVTADSKRLPSALTGAALFDSMPHPRFEGSGALAFYAPAPAHVLEAPELTLMPQAAPSSLQPAPGAHLTLRLRSVRGAPEALVVFPVSAKVADVSVATAAGPQRSKLIRLKSGATLLDVVGLPDTGVEFSVDVAGSLPVSVQVFDQSYDLAEGRDLQRLRPPNATSSQDGDLTVAHRTVSLDPAAGR
jgi:Peptidase family M28